MKVEAIITMEEEVVDITTTEVDTTDMGIEIIMKMMTLDILDRGEDHLQLMVETIIITHLQALCLVLHLMDMDTKDLEDMEVMDMGVAMTEILTAIILDTGTQVKCLNQKLTR